MKNKPQKKLPKMEKNLYIRVGLGFIVYQCNTFYIQYDVKTLISLKYKKKKKQFTSFYVHTVPSEFLISFQMLNDYEMVS